MSSAVSSKLVYRHNRVTRSTHWINTLALMILLMSGLQIFNAHPHLYWGSTSEPERAFFSIASTNDDGELRGYLQLYGAQVDTTGYLGVQPGVLAPSVRAFPGWLTVPGYYSLADARRWHFFFGWLFTLNGLLYVVYNLLVGHLRKFFLTFDDAKRVPAMIGYYLGLRKCSPQQGEYNPLQKLAYTSVFVIVTPAILLSGLAMSPQLNVAFNWLPAAFGGRQSARAIHFILAFGFLFFVFGHVFMVLTQGVFNNMRSMTTGWYREKVPADTEAARASAESMSPQQDEGVAQPETREVPVAAATQSDADPTASTQSSQTSSTADRQSETGEKRDGENKS